VVAHAQLLNRNVELATQICAVAAPVPQGLKAIEVAGAAAIIDPALVGEQKIAGTTPGIPPAWGSAIAKSPSATDGRSGGQP
jgi:hypothetical protein